MQQIMQEDECYSYDEALSLQVGEEKEEELREAQDWDGNIAGSIDYMIPFDGIAKDIQNWILDRSFKRQPALALAAALQILAVAKGRGQSAYKVKGNPYILGLSDSGTGKDWAFKAIELMLSECGLGHRVMGKAASGAALFEAIESSESMLMCVDEVGHYFEQIGGRKASVFAQEINTMITELYTSASSTFTDKARQGKKGAKIQEPNFCFFGVGTEGQLIKSWSNGAISDGTIARYLVFFGDNEVRRNKSQIYDNNIPAHIKSYISSFSSMAYSIDWQSTPLILAKGYGDAYNDLRDKYDDMALSVRHDFKKAKYQPLYTRLAVKAMQMALLLDDCSSLDVLAWCDNMVYQANEVFIKKLDHLMTDGDKSAEYLKSVENAIKMAGKDGITLAHIGDQCRSVAPFVRKQILHDLEERGKIFTRKKRLENGQGGFSRNVSLTFFWAK